MYNFVPSELNSDENVCASIELVSIEPSSVIPLLRSNALSNLKITINAEISLYGRKNALQRCFTNIINNGLTYGKKINVII